MCLFVCLFVCVTPGAIRIWRQKSIGCYKFFNSPFFQAYPGIRTRTIALHAFPHTLRIHTHSSKLLHVNLAFESPIWILRAARRCRITLDRTCPVPIPYRTVPSKMAGHNAYSNRAFKCKITMWNNLEELVCMRSVSGAACRARDSAGSNPRFKKKDFFKENIPMLFFV